MKKSVEYCGIIGRRRYGICCHLWIQLYLLRKCVGCDCVTYKYIQNICTVYTYTYYVYIDICMVKYILRVPVAGPCPNHVERSGTRWPPGTSPRPAFPALPVARGSCFAEVVLQDAQATPCRAQYSEHPSSSSSARFGSIKRPRSWNGAKYPFFQVLSLLQSSQITI